VGCRPADRFGPASAGFMASGPLAPTGDANGLAASAYLWRWPVSKVGQPGRRDRAPSATSRWSSPGRRRAEVVRDQDPGRAGPTGRRWSRVGTTVVFCSASFGSYAVATGYCYQLRTGSAGFRPHKWPFHAQNDGGEAGIRTLGPCGSAVFKSGSGRSWGFADDPIHEGIGRFRALESAAVRPCCYRLLLPVDTPERDLGAGPQRDLIGQARSRSCGGVPDSPG
jgi:hypothetical protein